MSNDKVREAIKHYLQRDIPLFPQAEISNWELKSGIVDNQGGRQTLGIFSGRFVDAVAFLVQDGSYNGWYCTNPLSEHHGIVRKCEIKILDKWNE